MLLKEGVWKGRRLVPQAWVEESTRSVSTCGEYIPGPYDGSVVGSYNSHNVSLSEWMRLLDMILAAYPD